MNRTELVEAVIGRVKSDDVVSKSQVERIVVATFEAIKDAVADGDNVVIAHFGTFKTVDRKATTAKNPRTGEEVAVPAKTVPKFTPGENFKNAVAGK